MLWKEAQNIQKVLTIFPISKSSTLRIQNCGEHWRYWRKRKIESAFEYFWHFRTWKYVVVDAVIPNLVWESVKIGSCRHRIPNLVWESVKIGSLSHEVLYEKKMGRKKRKLEENRFLLFELKSGRETKKNRAKITYVTINCFFLQEQRKSKRKLFSFHFFFSFSFLFRSLIYFLFFSLHANETLVN